jgi:choline dehydrogenase-like flavoprotein
LPNPNGQVGRGLTDHYLDFVIGRFGSYTGSSKGATSAARLDFPTYGGLEQVGVSPGLQAQALVASGRLVGRRLKAFMSDVDKLIGIAVIADDDVHPANRVDLSPTMAPDLHGPVARLSIRARTQRTLRNREYLAARAADLLRAAGARQIVRANFPGLLLHLHSTMRMGVSDGDSVLDADAEARWVKRLFVADNSALPNALGGPNPTLTTQALATRTAETIFVRYFDGEPWVGHESPVSSVDDAVTRAVADL